VEERGWAGRIVNVRPLDKPQRPARTKAELRLAPFFHSVHRDKKATAMSPFYLFYQSNIKAGRMQNRGGAMPLRGGVRLGRQVSLLTQSHLLFSNPSFIGCQETFVEAVWYAGQTKVGACRRISSKML
jgi:hypothetical protein